MPTTYTLFIFRRDLRAIDNVGLNHAMVNYTNIIPIFIFTPEQVGDNNKYRSNNAIQFMVESLQELDSVLRGSGSQLHILRDNNITALRKLVKSLKIEAVVFNQDYTPYAIKRDNAIKKECTKLGINCDTCEDYLMSKVGELNKANDTPYTVFTPFKNNGLQFPPPKPARSRLRNLAKVPRISLTFPAITKNPHIRVHGGRSNGLKALRGVIAHKNYGKNRNTVSISTTLLSAYIKFGCISIREVYWRVRSVAGLRSELMSQLYWREFYYYIVYFFPQVMGQNFNPRYDGIRWKWSAAHFKRWAEGKTGFPIVDAGMRELNTTGYMHNRARLITANFLNRMLGMDWRKGEQYYATQLTDYDPAVNNGNWQWVASTGVDPKPYFQRLFNPMQQSSKYDPNAIYIKKWLPELVDIPAAHLHDWGKYHVEYNVKELGYYKPIVDYTAARKDSISLYRSIL